MRRLGVIIMALALVGLGGFASSQALTAVPASAEGAQASAWFRLHGKVVSVIDGDTLVVRVGLKRHRVRLIGIDAPERGACFSAEATAAARALALNERVTLVGDRTQSRRDRFGRLLA